MPTYDYLCKTCGHRFEHFQSITSDALSHCPESECIMTDPELKGKGEVQRIVSGGAGLVFKGEGFYLTDYVRKGKEGEGKKSGGSKGSDANKSGSKGSGSSGGDSKGTSSAKDSGSK